MRTLYQCRNVIRAANSAEGLTDEELLLVAENAPDCCWDWVEKEAVSLLHELARRLKTATEQRETLDEFSVRLASIRSILDGVDARSFALLEGPVTVTAEQLRGIYDLVTIHAPEEGDA